jgi:hypothetical protein
VKSNANIDFERELILYGGKKQTPVSLKSLMDTGKGSLLSEFEAIKGNQIQTSTASELVLFQIASFLHRELPVRIAHRVEHLQSAPYLQNNGTFFNDLRTFTLLVLHSTLGVQLVYKKSADGTRTHLPNCVQLQRPQQLKRGKSSQRFYNRYTTYTPRR